MKNFKQRKDLTDLHLRKIILADIWKIQGRVRNWGAMKTALQNPEQKCQGLCTGPSSPEKQNQ